MTNKAFFNYIDMNVVNPNDTEHEIVIIPRYYPADEIVLSLYNEATQTSEDILNGYVIVNGKITITFDYTFNEGDRYQIRITENLGVAYRGKLFATTQQTQQYNPSANAYYY